MHAHSHSNASFSPMTACPNCGAGVVEHALHCGYCGTRVRAEAAMPRGFRAHQLDTSALYDGSLGWVSRARAVFHGTTFATANIATVRTDAVPPRKERHYKAVAAGLGMAVLGWLFGGVWMMLLGLLVAGVAIYLLTLLRPTYLVRVTTLAGQNVCVATSQEAEEICRVRTALDHAIALVH